MIPRPTPRPGLAIRKPISCLKERKHTWKSCPAFPRKKTLLPIGSECRRQGRAPSSARFRLRNFSPLAIAKNQNPQAEARATLFRKVHISHGIVPRRSKPHSALGIIVEFPHSISHGGSGILSDLAGGGI